MRSGVTAEESLCDEHVNETAQTTHEDDLARLAILVWFPSAQFGDQLYLFPLKSNPHLIKKSSRDPCQGHQCLECLPIKDLYLFPTQTLFGNFKTIFSSPAFSIHHEDA